MIALGIGLVAVVAMASVVVLVNERQQRRRRRASGRRVWVARRVGPWTPGRAYESGWTYEEVAP